MLHWQQVRAAANKVRADIFTADESPEISLDAAEILRRLADLTEIKCCPAAATDPILQKSLAFLAVDWQCLFFNQDLPEWFARFCQAHEFGHFFLHRDSHHCAQKDLETAPLTDDSPLGENRVASGYSPLERREREANLFARELLLPAALLKKLFVENNWRAADFKIKTGLNLDLIRQQLAFALLINSEIDVGKPEAAPPAPIKLNENQNRAAVSKSQRLLIEAGPGTGKTRTLTARIRHLLDEKVEPKNILALTFSNKAAEEMRERIAVFAPEAAKQIWLGTFHAFGLEILRKYAAEANIKPDFQLIDPIDAGLLLEKHLLELDLRHYQNLKQPTANLKSILGAISRAKDEMCGAEKYRQTAAEMLIAADDDETIIAAEKAAEVARVYAFYERLLSEQNSLEIGDLIFRAVKLLDENAAVKSDLQNCYQHVLVDEFQDVNRACGLLLKHLNGETGNLWVVGDARQNIYRWRGASGANMRLFAADFPASESLSLSENYRSEPRIIELLNEFAPHVEAVSETFTNWQSVRETTGAPSVVYAEAENFADEAEFIAAQIKTKLAAGLSFRDQAVLGRTNSILSKFARELTKREIPILYLGNLFERPEIKDLLCLIALSSENRGRHLLRLCEMPEYKVDLSAALRLIAVADRAGTSFPAAFQLAENEADFSAETRTEFAKIARIFADVEDGTEATTWQFLAYYLFDASDFLLSILNEKTVAARQKCFALYQFLQFALSENDGRKSHFADTANPRRAFLRFVRHLAASGEETVFRRLPAWAEEIEAVKLLTIHQAKGLEFPVVYLPHLGNKYYPNSRRGEVCPLPSALKADLSDSKSEHEAEEKCLFFVAVSRARDELILTRAKKYGGATSNQSRFLELLQTTLPCASPIESIDLEPENPPEIRRSNNRLYSFYELTKYRNCPRRYFYEHHLNLRGNHDEATYFQFHQNVYAVIGWAKEQKSGGKSFDDAAANAKLEEIWLTKPLAAHPYSPIYLTEARELVTRIVDLLTASNQDFEAAPRLEMKIGNGRVSVKPDLLEMSAAGDAVTIRKIRTGKLPRDRKFSDHDKLTLAAFLTAANQNFPTAEISVAVNYLSSDNVLTYTAPPKQIATQTDKLENAIAGIEREDFRPSPDVQSCPSCAHYFLCSGES